MGLVETGEGFAHTGVVHAALGFENGVPALYAAAVGQV